MFTGFTHGQGPSNFIGMDPCFIPFSKIQCGKGEINVSGFFIKEESDFNGFFGNVQTKPLMILFRPQPKKTLPEFFGNIHCLPVEIKGVPPGSEERRVGKACVRTVRSRWSLYH